MFTKGLLYLRTAVLCMIYLRLLFSLGRFCKRHFFKILNKNLLALIVVALARSKLAKENEPEEIP